MLSPCNQYGDVLATEVQQEDGPFYCPACRERVIVKKGWVKVPHFAHLPDADCSYIGEGESDEHQLACQEYTDSPLRYWRDDVWMST
jgi:competence protein CoiA